MSRKLSASIALAILASVPFGFALHVDDDAAAPKDSKASTVVRAVEYVIDKGEAWVKERKCVSCHMIPFTLWSLNEASAGGYKVPAERFKTLTQWSLDDVTRVDPGVEGLALVIVAGEGASRIKDQDEYFKRYANKLIEKQLPNGSWSPGGQTPQQKRSLSESKQVVTMWAMLALDSQLGKSAGPAIKRAQSTLPQGSSGQSNEWIVTRLLVARRFGESTEKEKQTRLLIQTQNKDGGWGWINGEESDAIATGQSLYALSFTSGGPVKGAISKGRKFLESTQRTDGSWEVKSTLAQHKSEVMPTSVYWGTTWAVIGLCRTESSARRQ